MLKGPQGGKLADIMRVAFAILALAFISAAARAQIVANPYFPYVCDRSDREYVQPDPLAPPLVSATLAQFPQLAFRICADKFGDSHYFLRAPGQTTIGVCVFYEAEVFSPVDPNAVVRGTLVPNDPNADIHWWAPPKPWSRNPFGGQNAIGTRVDRMDFSKATPDGFMAEAASPCPKFSENVYAGVNDVSPETFKVIGAYWRSLAASESKFEEALTHLDPAVRCEPAPEPLATRVRNNAVMAARASLFDRHEELRIWNMSYRDNRYWMTIGATPERALTSVTVVYADGEYQLRCLDGVWVP